MLLPFLIQSWSSASADGRAMLGIYLAQVGVIVSLGLVLRFLVLV